MNDKPEQSDLPPEFQDDDQTVSVSASDTESSSTVDTPAGDPQPTQPLTPGEKKAQAKAKHKEERAKMTFFQKLWYDWIKPIAPIIIVLLMARSVLWDMNDVPSESMYPTILVGDRLFVNKHEYGWRVPFSPWWMTYSDPGPERGDIAIMFSPLDGTRLVKRILAVPGDKVLFNQFGQVQINGETAKYTEFDPKLLDDYQISPGFPRIQSYKGYRYFVEELLGHKRVVMFPPANDIFTVRQMLRGWKYAVPQKIYTVPEGQYLAIGDNRAHSKDSRMIGTVPRENIIGKATNVLFSRDGWITPRNSRWWLDMQELGKIIDNQVDK